MLNTTLPRLRCPACAGELSLEARKVTGPDGLGIPHPPTEGGVFEVVFGALVCGGCEGSYPILSGVAVLVEDVGAYLLNHVKGLAARVPDEEIPEEFRVDYLEAKGALEAEHIEEDLEADRVISLYMANHYLTTGVEHAGWWKPAEGAGSPLLDSLIREHWDRGPLARIRDWVEKLARQGEALDSVIEVGCGVGGLSRALGPWIGRYLGVDSSFASVALGRHLALGVPFDRAVAIPGDLLQGPLSREIRLAKPPAFDGKIDLVVGDLEALPVVVGEFDLSLALNAIDMLPAPDLLPALQHGMLRPGGIAIQSGPYIWHETVAAQLRMHLPTEIQDSADAVEWLYRESGFAIEERIEHLPWLFYKHLRQLEIYSVHLFRARRH